MVTSAAVQAANPYFALGKIIPLDMSIELEQGLCDTLSEALIQVHVPDEKNPGIENILDGYFYLYDENLNKIYEQNNKNINFSCKKTGIYYLFVSQYEGDKTGNTGFYVYSK